MYQDLVRWHCLNGALVGGDTDKESVFIDQIKNFFKIWVGN